jgi:hypothetical protein
VDLVWMLYCRTVPDVLPDDDALDGYSSDGDSVGGDLSSEAKSFPFAIDVSVSIEPDRCVFYGAPWKARQEPARPSGGSSGEMGGQVGGDPRAGGRRVAVAPNPVGRREAPGKGSAPSAGVFPVAHLYPAVCSNMFALELTMCSCSAVSWHPALRFCPSNMQSPSAWGPRRRPLQARAQTVGAPRSVWCSL